MLLSKCPLAYNNIPSVIPQVGFGKGNVYTNLTAGTWKVERLFLINPLLKKKHIKVVGENDNGM